MVLEALALDIEFFGVWPALLAGLAASVAIECGVQPRPPLRRAWAAWAIHLGIWCLAYGLAVVVLGRPWFSAAAVSAFLLVLVLVNNAKYQALREPFLFQDYDYFTDAVRHPRLYIPFLGWGKFLLAALGVVLAVAVGLWMEEAPEARWRWTGHLGGILAALVSGAGLLILGTRFARQASYKPLVDLKTLGFLGSLWRYALAPKVPAGVASPFEAPPIARTNRPTGQLPHLVVIQSESFFDPRPLFGGIRRDMLAAFDALQRDAAFAGQLTVPAWGANTIRTEFAFLTGIAAQRLGVQRFNAYRAIAAGWQPASLASWLKHLGYRTVCIHPYPASFYQRDRVYPRLGFDTFLDIRAFEGVSPAGPYMDDQAVAAKVTQILAQATEPTLVMAITMENHGPLQLETVAPGEVDAFYTTAPPPGCEDLTIYLRHLRHADQMAAQLRQTLQACDRPASLCWYGDHVPIMPQVYRTFGLPAGTVPYVCWNNDRQGRGNSMALSAEELSARWLEATGLAAGHTISGMFESSNLP